MNIKRYAIVAAALCAMATLAQSEPDTTGRGWKPTKLDLEVTVRPEAWRMELRGELTLKLEGQDESMGPTIGVNTRAPCVLFESVDCEGAKTELNARHPKLESARLATVRFEEAKIKGDTVRVRFSCSVPGHENQIEVTPGAAISSWTSGWYPVPVPDEGEGLQAVNRAPGTMTFRLPQGWSAVTGGKKRSHEEKDGAVVEVWDVPQAIARSFAAAPYKTFEGSANGVAVSVSLITKDSPYAVDQIGALVKAVDALQEKLGPYPYPGFSIAEVPMDVGNFGASSEQGFIMVKPNFLDCKGGNLALFAHEAAHAWWGNTVGTTSPAGIMCDEALAQYGAVIAIEKVEGPEGVRSFLEFSRPGYIFNQCAKGYFEIVRSGKDIPLMELKTGGVSHTLSDSKGHWVYHMLRERVGDEVFFATLRGLIRKYSTKPMSLADVRREFIAAAPEIGLETFFAQWLDRKGAPVFEVNKESADGKTRIALVQAGDVYDLPLELEWTAASGKKARQRIQVKDRETVFEVEGEVEKLELDPDRKLLIWREAYGARP
ncbi:MAG: hypothetical protein KF805_13020 [Phycisphaeraceae bacterium]|nr:hypothetical protein [Phycisphaeraceae bacterium]